MQSRLSMNNIIDVSNESKGSQMDLFHTDSAKNIQQLLDQTRPQIQSIDCIVPESYIQKVNFLYKFHERCLLLNCVS